MGKNLSFLTRWFKKKIKWVQIWEKVKFIFDFWKWRLNFDFFQKWLQQVERSRKRLKKTYEVKFFFMEKKMLYSFEKEAYIYISQYEKKFFVGSSKYYQIGLQSAKLWAR